MSDKINNYLQKISTESVKIRIDILGVVVSDKECKDLNLLVCYKQLVFCFLTST